MDTWKATLYCTQAPLAELITRKKNTEQTIIRVMVRKQTRMGEMKQKRHHYSSDLL